MSRLKKDRKLLDEVLDVMRLHHYSIHTERTHCGWIKRYIQYHLTSKETRFGYNFYELISLTSRGSRISDGRGRFQGHFVKIIPDSQRRYHWRAIRAAPKSPSWGDVTT
mgnify:CR=1 FL=1